jgi:hypothetical protein
MSHIQELYYLQRIFTKSPRINFRAAMRRVDERKAVLAKVNELRAYEDARRDAERRQEWAGYSEGLV